MTRRAAVRHISRVSKASAAHQPSWIAISRGAAEAVSRPTYSDSGTCTVYWNGRNELTVRNPAGKNHSGANVPDSRSCANCRIRAPFSFIHIHRQSRSTTSSR
jgi:hypothetical protein